MIKFYTQPVSISSKLLQPVLSSNFKQLRIEFPIMSEQFNLFQVISKSISKRFQAVSIQQSTDKPSLYLLKIFSMKKVTKVFRNFKIRKRNDSRWSCSAKQRRRNRSSCPKSCDSCPCALDSVLVLTVMKPNACIRFQFKSDVNLCYNI